jgi:Uma2 family endonuclease
LLFSKRAYRKEGVMASELETALWAEVVPDAPYPMSLEAFLRLPRDAWKYELVEGRLIRMHHPTLGHGRIALNLAVELRTHADARQLGYVLIEPGFVLSPPGAAKTISLAPDVACVDVSRVPPPSNTAFWFSTAYLAPDLAVEIASPSQYRPEMSKKARAWLSYGVRLVWMIWPKKKEVDVWRPGDTTTPSQTLRAGDALDGLNVVAGFTMPVADLFAF